MQPRRPRHRQDEDSPFPVQPTGRTQSLADRPGPRFRITLVLLATLLGLLHARTRARHATGHSARTAAKLQVPTAAHLPISPRPDSAGAFPLCVCLLLHDLVQSWLRGGGILEDMCYERRRAKACVD